MSLRRRWLRTIKAGVKVERSRRTLIEGNVMELSGPLTLNQFGVGGWSIPAWSARPTRPICRSIFRS
jgi:hypothetical protein